MHQPHLRIYNPSTNEDQNGSGVFSPGLIIGDLEDCSEAQDMRHILEPFTDADLSILAEHAAAKQRAFLDEFRGPRTLLNTLRHAYEQVFDFLSDPDAHSFAKSPQGEKWDKTNGALHAIRMVQEDRKAQRESQTTLRRRAA